MIWLYLKISFALNSTSKLFNSEPPFEIKDLLKTDESAVKVIYKTNESDTAATAITSETPVIDIKKVAATEFDKVAVVGVKEPASLEIEETAAKEMKDTTDIPEMNTIDVNVTPFIESRETKKETALGITDTVAAFEKREAAAIKVLEASAFDIRETPAVKINHTAALEINERATAGVEVKKMTVLEIKDNASFEVEKSSALDIKELADGKMGAAATVAIKEDTAIYMNDTAAMEVKDTSNFEKTAAVDLKNTATDYLKMHAALITTNNNIEIQEQGLMVYIDSTRTGNCLQQGMAQMNCHNWVCLRSIYFFQLLKE